MKRGEIVKVRAYPEKILERRVWSETRKAILLCTEEGYQKAIAEQSEPITVPFPKADILLETSGTSH